MTITPEYVMKQLEGFLWAAADKEKVLKILDKSLSEAWEDGYDTGLDDGRPCTLESLWRDRYAIYLAAVKDVPGIVTKSYDEWTGN